MKSKHADHSQPGSEFVPLLHGAENHEFVKLRQVLFADAWTEIDARIQVRHSQPGCEFAEKAVVLTLFVLCSMF